jgi:arylsulfatase A-like enzyme
MRCSGPRVLGSAKHRPFSSRIKNMTKLNRRDFLGHTVCGLVAGTFIGLGGSKAFAGEGISTRHKPNIVYVLTDQWRAQATGYGGDPNVKTPNLDAMASESINFENAVSVCPVCTPYRASLMTGRYPLSTGMFMNDLYLPREELCMAEIFKKAGYDTGYIGKWHLDGHGRDTFIPKERRQGFDYWKVLECTHNYNNSFYYGGDDTTKHKWDGYDTYAQTKDAQAYIENHAGSPKPFLLVVSFGTPHFPHHTAPQELREKYPVSSIELRPNVPNSMKNQARKEAQGYYAHCTATDRCIGDLRSTLKATGLSENTIFVFTSDHGEMLGSHGQPPCEKQRPWDESILVPFLISYPAITGHQGRIVKTPINTPDILPTLLSLADIPVPATVEGENLSRLITDEIPDEDRAALIMSVFPFAGYHNGKAFRGIRTARYTYVRSIQGPWLLYDTKNDPYQMKNLIGSADHANLQQALEDRLQAKLKETGDKFFPKERYLEEWGYTVDGRGCIPYRGNQKVQSPANRPK